MTPAQAILAKELRACFVSPVVYVVGAVFLFSFGILSFVLVRLAGGAAVQQMQVQGMAAMLNLNDMVFRPAFYWTGILILLILLPVLTMRLFAEERKLRTFELLMTSPIAVTQMVAAKFLSAFLVFLGLLALTSVVPLVLSVYNNFDWSPVLAGYLGLALLGALYLATGIFASAVTENQIIAVLGSFGTLFMLWLLGLMGSQDTLAGKVLSYVSYSEHFVRLLRGLVDTKDIVYFLSSSFFMLFLTHRVVESQRWK